MDGRGYLLAASHEDGSADQLGIPGPPKKAVNSSDPLLAASAGHVLNQKDFRTSWSSSSFTMNGEKYVVMFGRLTFTCQVIT